MRKVSLVIEAHLPFSVENALFLHELYGMSVHIQEI